MKSENAIEIVGVKKHFKVYYDKSRSIKERVLFKNRNRYEMRRVLNGISFKIKKGEAIGLIGENGCGKSTTLKLLTRIIYPDEGTITMEGRVSSLIELGAGFHPDMSGRENIYTNASIFGLTRKEIELRMNDIIDFSELEDYLDNPVRTYSSGMYMRLAFSVAINVDADILLIDEILAVGDANFQAKCMNKLREIKAAGTTIVIVSHSMSQIEQICDRCIWIKDGTVYKDDTPNEVIYQYLDYMGEYSKSLSKKRKNEIEDKEIDKQENKQKIENITINEKIGIASEVADNKIAVIEDVKLLHQDGTIDTHFKTGEEVILRITYTAITRYLDSPIIGLKLYRNDNVNVFGTNTQNEHIQVKLNEKGYIQCCFDKFNLIAGEYFLDVAIRSKDMFAYDYKSHAAHFYIYNTYYEEGIVHLDHQWKFK